MFAGDIIGGSEPGEGNVISGNHGFGAAVGGKALVQGNYIGTDLTGTKPLGNDGFGIGINQNSVLGGTSPGAGNVISANGLGGVVIGSSGNVVQGNKIGTDVTGTRNFGNGGDGISILTSYAFAADDTIGGAEPGAGNVIAYNVGRGVSAIFGAGNDIRGNDIVANGDLGIVADLNGVLSTYAEARAVDLPHAAPVLTSAVFGAQGTLLNGTLTGAPFTRYDIDFFANVAFEPSGFGQGQNYLESISVLIDDTGWAQFQIRLDDAIPVGQWITTTVTDPAGNTSQFSRSIPVVAAVPPNTIQFTASSYVVTENGGVAVVGVTRTGSTTGAVSVDYATSHGSAAAGANYTAASGTLTFNDGETSKTLAIPIRDDGIADGNKTFQIVLSNPTGAGLGSLNIAAVTITDDNQAGRINFATSAFTVDRSMGGDVFEVIRTGGSQGKVTVDYQVTGGTAIGSPRLPKFFGEQLDADYLDAFGTVTFEDGQMTAEIDVTRITQFINGNLGRPVYRGPRTIEVTLGNPTGGATLGAVITSTLTVEDEEDRAGAFSIGGQVNVHESDGSAFVNIERLGNLFSVETIHYTTVDGTAKAGVNYVASSGTLTFNAGESAKAFFIPILDDKIVDDPGSFQIVISNPQGGAFVFDGLDRWTITILDSDSPPSPGSFVVEPNSFETAGIKVDENAGFATVNIQRVDGSQGFVTVDYMTSDGTAKAGSDYVATSGTLTFASGETSKSFTIPILSDNLVEGDETFFVTLSNPTGGATIGSELFGTPVDNPTPVIIYETPGQFQFTASDYKVAENDAGFTITVEFDAFPDPKQLADPNGRLINIVTVDYSIHNGTASAGEDYTALSGTLTFDNIFYNKQTITIPILDDLQVELDETIVLTLSNATGGAGIRPNATAILTILDEDSQRSMAQINAGGPYSILEGDPLTLSASVIGADPAAVSWDLNGDGVFGDATGSNPTLSWAQLQTLGISDGPSTFDVRAQVTDATGLEITSEAASLTVQNADPTAQFGNGGEVAEGSPGTVSFSDAFDPSPQDMTAGFRYSYDFDNDGTFEIINSTSPMAAVPANYLDDGPESHTVRARIEDKDGGFTDYTTTINISNVAPLATLIAPSVVHEGDTFTVSLANQSDPSSADTSAGFRYVFALDGASLTNATYANSAATSSQDFTIDDGPSDHEIIVRIFDKDGGFMDYTASIHANNLAPTVAILGPPVTSPEGMAIHLDSSVNDPSSADQAAGFAYSWSVTKDGLAFASGSGPGFAFTPDDNGSYVVHLTAADKDQGTGTAMDQTISVFNQAPTATLSNNSPVNVGDSAVLSFSNPSDPSTVDAAAGFHYSFALSPTGLETSYDAASADRSPSYAFTTVGAFDVFGRIFDKDNGFTDYQTTVTVLGNGGPSQVTLTPTSAPINEGDTATFAGSFTDMGSSDGHTVVITWGDGSPRTLLPLSARVFTFSANHRYFDNLPGNAAFAIDVTVTNKAGASGAGSATLIVDNMAPVLGSVSGPGLAVRGQALNFSDSFADPGTLDMHSANINWGDGTNSSGVVMEHQGSGSVSASHVYTDSGKYTVTLTATDKDGGSASVSRQVTIVAAALLPDPCDLRRTALFVGGTVHDDEIEIEPGCGRDQIRVEIEEEGPSVGCHGSEWHATFIGPISRIIVFGQAGNDDIQVAGGVRIPAWLFGGDGNDRLKGGDGDNVLIGAAGNDQLIGGKGHDMLIGGSGADQLVAGPGEDILIGGSTAFDSSLKSICALMDEWSRQDERYRQRVDHILGKTPGGLNGTIVLNASTVFDDLAPDVLQGASGHDLFIVGVGDKVRGAT